MIAKLIVLIDNWIYEQRDIELEDPHILEKDIFKQWMNYSGGILEEYLSIMAEWLKMVESRITDNERTIEVAVAEIKSEHPLLFSNIKKPWCIYIMLMPREY